MSGNATGSSSSFVVSCAQVVSCTDVPVTVKEVPHDVRFIVGGMLRVSPCVGAVDDMDVRCTGGKLHTLVGKSRVKNFPTGRYARRGRLTCDLLAAKVETLDKIFLSVIGGHFINLGSAAFRSVRIVLPSNLHVTFCCCVTIVDTHFYRGLRAAVD